MRKSNRSNSGASGAGGRMQRIVSQAGFYAATRLSSESNDAMPTTATNTRSKAFGSMSDSLASEQFHRGVNGLIRYRLPGTVNTISISQDRELVAVAGREGIGEYTRQLIKLHD